jgi:glutathione S-transferase
MVPMLELDDGTQIGEAMAIARYFEETQPDPPLMGTDAKDKAIVENVGKTGKRGRHASRLRTVPQHASAIRRTRPAGSGRRDPGDPELRDRGRARLDRKFDRQLPTTRSSPASVSPSQMPPPWQLWISPAGRT